MAAAKPTHAEHAIPDGWQRVRLGDVADVAMGQSPPGEVVVDWDGDELEDDGLPFVQGNAEFGTKYPAPLKWCLQPYKVGIPGDVLISVRAPVGETNRVATQLGIGRGLATVRFDIDSQPFGWHVLNHSKSALDRVTQGSTFAAIGGGELRNLSILLPPLPEQRTIAAVLDSVDDAVEGAEAVIAATEGLRDALLHDLLTRGLPGQHTEFRDVPGLGTIPSDWDVVRLGDVAEVTSGIAMAPHRIPKMNPRPYLTVANVQAGQVNVDENRLMEVAESEYKSRTLLTGDVVLVEGHAQISQLGRAAIIPPEAEGFTFQNHLFRVRTGQLSDARFVASYVNGQGGRRYFGSFGGTTSGLNTVSAANVKALPIPLPSLSEQHQIAAALDGVDTAIEAERDELAGLRLLKDSTADSLLSGRVRVQDTR